MFKKSSFGVVFNVFLAFFITLVLTIFVKATGGNLTAESLVIGMIEGFCLNLTLETLIDLPGLGSKFVALLHMKQESKAAYFVRIFAIVVVIVLLMSFFLMFCEIGFAMGVGFLGFWITKVPAIFVVAYITAIIVFVPCLKATQALCTKE